MAIGGIMCFGNANKEDPDAKKSREIEKQLRDDQRRLSKEVKLLLLGESTIGKLISGNGLTMSYEQVRESRASPRCSSRCD